LSGSGIGSVVTGRDHFTGEEPRWILRSGGLGSVSDPLRLLMNSSNFRCRNGIEISFRLLPVRSIGSKVSFGAVGGVTVGKGRPRLTPQCLFFSRAWVT